MNITLFDIYIKFVKIGCILIGGGYVILPILKQEMINSSKWLTKDELIDFYVISQSLPGLIAINISIFIGYKLKKIYGAISAAIGIITAPFICILLLAFIMSYISNLSIIKSLFWGLNFGIIILVISSVKEMWPNTIIDKYTLILFCLFLFIILKFSISPAILILLGIVSGIFIKSLVKMRTKR